MKFDPRIYGEIAAQPYPLVFATVSGAHLYGFPSPDSDYDLRGVHVLPLRAVLGLEEHAEMRALVPQLLTRHHAHHYLGFAETQWRLFLKEEPRRVKPLLYVFRVLLTGIHLMQTGMVEADLVRLNETFQLTYIP